MATCLVRRAVPRGFAALALLAAVLSATSAQAVDRAWLPGELVGTLPERVPETSGLTEGSRDDGIWFTHNDSTDLPFDPTASVVYAVTTTGELVAELDLQGIGVTDVEDIAWGPGVDGVTPAIYVADVGDNFTIRPQLLVYVFEEPELDPTGRDESVAITDVATYTVTFPGERHDVETLLVHPVTGELTLVTKTTTGISQLFTAPRPTTSAAAAVLTQAGTVDFGAIAVRDSYNPDFPDNELQATGGEISPDGSHVVIRTYTEAHEWSLGPDGDVAAAVGTTPVNVVVPEEQQGEAIMYEAQSRALVTSSEGTRTLHRMARATATAQPTPAEPALPATGGGLAIGGGALAALTLAGRRR